MCKYFVGADLHKERTWFVVMDETGNTALSMSIPNSPVFLKKFFKSLPGPFILAVEATYNWYFFMDIAEQYAERVYLANSYELKAFARRHKKTDKIDARLIADVLRKGYLPSVFIPDEETRRLKELVHYRMNLVRDRCRNIFRLKNMLDKLGIDSTGDFTTAKHRESIPPDTVAEPYRHIITGYSGRIASLGKELYAMRLYFKDRLSGDRDIQNLITIDGIDYFSAAVIKSEIADIKRFASFARLCAYAGLAPRVSQSGNKAAVHGPLMTNRRKDLQWILLEIVYHYIKASAERQARYLVLKMRKGANTAKVIMARQLLKIIYHVLKEQRPYYVVKGDQRDQANQLQSVAAVELKGV